MVSESSAAVDRLSREAEITRSGLVNSVVELNKTVGDTIDDLKERLAPSHIKQEVKGYVREESSQLLSSIQRKARDNPLQAVALGAAVMYPLWGILKSIPIPILLVGGGVLLSKNNRGKIARSVTETATDVVHSLKEAQEPISAEVSAAADTISDTAKDMLDTATTAASEAAAAVKDRSADALGKVSETASGLRGAGADIVSRSRTALDDLIDKNPMLVGGVALAIGAFVAASIPISSTENRLFGKRSDDVKDKALGAVSQGVERAKNAAADITGDIAAAAAREGLSAEGLSRTIEGTAVAVESVVDAGLTAALGTDGEKVGSSDASTNNMH
jgi:ElaB/YqjD/DUF883 family membrane-anchored ribosome-binding protein